MVDMWDIQSIHGDNERSELFGIRRGVGAAQTNISETKLMSCIILFCLLFVFNDCHPIFLDWYQQIEIAYSVCVPHRRTGPVDFFGTHIFARFSPKHESITECPPALYTRLGGGGGGGGCLLFSCPARPILFVCSFFQYRGRGIWDLPS